MKERREYKRFQLRLPARMEMISPGRKQVFDFRTRDISAGGVYIDTKEPLSKDTRFRLKLTLPSKRIKELTGAQSCIKVEGTVVRSTPTGVAIRFGEDYQILSLKGL